MSVQILVQTSGGNHIYPANFQIATLENGSMKYRYAADLKSVTRNDSMTLLMRKSAAEGIELRDLLFTWWTAVPQYTSDRRLLFSEVGAELPTTPKFKVALENIAARGGVNNSNVDLSVEFIYNIVKDYGYTKGTVASWYSGNVILPESRDALRDLASRSGGEQLHDMYSTLDGDNFLPYRRLVTVHRAVMSALAAPKGEGTGKPRISGENTNQGRIITLADYMEPAREIYGADLREVLKQVKLLRVTEIVQIEQRNRSLPIGIEKGLVGFAAENVVEKEQTLKRFVGTDRGKELEIALNNRAKIILQEAVPTIIATNVAEAEIDRENNRRLLETGNVQSVSEKLRQRLVEEGATSMTPTPNNIRGVYLGVIDHVAFMFSPFTGSKQNSVEYEKTMTDLVWALARDREKRARIREVSKMPADRIERDGKDLPYLGYFIKKANQIYDNSPIDRSAISRKDWLSLSLPQFSDYVNNLWKGSFELYPQAKWESIAQDLINARTRLTNIHWNIVRDYKLEEVMQKTKKIEIEYMVPTSLIVIQHQTGEILGQAAARSKSSVEKLKHAYDVTNFTFLPDYIFNLTVSAIQDHPNHSR